MFRSYSVPILRATCRVARDVPQLLTVIFARPLSQGVFLYSKTMHSMHCTLCNLPPMQCTLCNALYAMHSMQCNLCNAHQAMHSISDRNAPELATASRGKPRVPASSSALQRVRASSGRMRMGVHCIECIALIAWHRVHCIGCIAWHRLHFFNLAHSSKMRHLLNAPSRELVQNEQRGTLQLFSQTKTSEAVWPTTCVSELHSVHCIQCIALIASHTLHCILCIA